MPDVLRGPEAKHYAGTLASTRSELAVPIFGTDGVTLKGVLNLESEERHAFMPYHVGELQAAAWQLLPDLLIVESLRKREQLCGWHPEVSGWTLTSLLNDFCNEIATSLVESTTVQTLSCSIWHADWEKACLYVRGTAKFNFEYISKKLMPLIYDEKSPRWSDLPPNPEVPECSWLAGEHSYTAGIAASPRGTVGRELLSDLALFNRPAKAARMGVSYLIATPIYEPSDDPELEMRHPTPDSEPGGAQNGIWFGGTPPSSGEEMDVALKAAAAEPRSCGVLSLYFFKRQHPQHEFSIAGLFPDQDVIWLSNTLGSVIKETKVLREQVAMAQLLAKMYEDGIPHVNMADHLKQLAKRCVEADGCSIFLAEPWIDPNVVFRTTVWSRLEELSTTGLDRTGDSRNPPDEYPAGSKDAEEYRRAKSEFGFDGEKKVDKTALRIMRGHDGCGKSLDHWLQLRGLTGFLSATPDSIVRKIDIPDPWELGSATLAKGDKSTVRWMSEPLKQEQTLFVPGNRIREAAVPTDVDHRRFLGASTAVDTRGDRPVAGIIRTVRRPDVRPYVDADGKLLHSLAVAFKSQFALEHRCRREFHDVSLMNLNCPDCGSALWNRRYIEALLQFLLVNLRDVLDHPGASVAGGNGSEDTKEPTSQDKETAARVRCRQLFRCNDIPFDVAYVRTRSRLGQDSWALRYYASHAMETTQMPIERKSTNVFKNDKNYEWMALSDNKVVAVIWEGEGRKKVATGEVPDHQVKVGHALLHPLRPGVNGHRIAICIPMGVMTLEEEPDAILVLEGALQPNVNDADHVQAILDLVTCHAMRFARMFSCVGRDNSSVGDASRLPEERILCEAALLEAVKKTYEEKIKAINNTARREFREKVKTAVTLEVQNMWSEAEINKRLAKKDHLLDDNWGFLDNHEKIEGKHGKANEARQALHRLVDDHVEKLNAIQKKIAGLQETIEKNEKAIEKLRSDKNKPEILARLELCWEGVKPDGKLIPATLWYGTVPMSRVFLKPEEGGELPGDEEINKHKGWLLEVWRELVLQQPFVEGVASQWSCVLEKSRGPEWASTAYRAQLVRKVAEEVAAADPPDQGQGMAETTNS